MSDADVIRHVMIRGRVHGVGFRAFVEHMALRRGLRGWVRNRRDGAVEAVFAGAGDVVDDMIAACRHGPGGARVDSLEDSRADDALLAPRYAGELFSVLPTA